LVEYPSDKYKVTEFELQYCQISVPTNLSTALSPNKTKQSKTNKADLCVVGTLDPVAQRSLTRHKVDTVSVSSQALLLVKFSFFFANWGLKLGFTA
jgi:hypothetical protein